MCLGWQGRRQVVWRVHSQSPVAFDALPPPLVPASVVHPSNPQQDKKLTPAPATSDTPAIVPAAPRKLDNAGVIRRAPPVPPGIDLRTHAGLSSKVPLSGTTIQANCFRCFSSIFYKPECAQVTCCESSTVILSVEVMMVTIHCNARDHPPFLCL